MKRVILTTIFVLCAAAVSAQLSVRAGYANSDWHNKSGDGASRHGATLGVGYEFGLNPSQSLSLRPSLTYTAAFQATDASRTITRNVAEHTLGLPVHVRFSLPVSDHIRVYAFAGPSLGFGLAYRVKETFTLDPLLPPDPINAKNYQGTITSDLFSGKVEGTIDDPRLLEDRRAGNPRYGRVDVALGGGVGVSWRRLFVEAGYDYGLLNRSKKEGEIKRQQLAVALGYTF